MNTRDENQAAHDLVAGVTRKGYEKQALASWESILRDAPNDSMLGRLAARLMALEALVDKQQGMLDELRKQRE